MRNSGSRINQIGTGLIISKPNSFGNLNQESIVIQLIIGKLIKPPNQIQKSMAIQLIIGYRKLIKPSQSLPSIRTYSTRMHLPKPVLPQYIPTQESRRSLFPQHIPTQGSRRTLFSRATSLRKEPCTWKSQVDYLMQRVIRRAEKNTAPVRRLSTALFGRALAPLEPDSRPARLEQKE